MSWIRSDFKKYLAQTSPDPLMFHPVRGEGVYFFDQSGKKYLDLISGISVSALGQGHSRVKKAVETQLEKYTHTMVYGEFILTPQLELARLVLSTLPESLDNIYFVNSGSEAVEGAIKLAFKYTGRRELIACKNAYHGSTTGALSLMSDEYYSGGYKPLLPNVQYIDFNSVDSLVAITENTAAVFVETVQGEAGYLPADKEFMTALRKRCSETGCLLVLDEIQAGMGRTGKFWAFEHYGIVPDILLTAKGFGGGLPLGAFIARREVMSALSDKPILGHITTFGGNPLSCAASMATIEEILEGELHLGAVAKGELFKARLREYGLDKVSGMGLMLGVNCGDFSVSQRMVKRCLEKGLITDWFLYETGKLRICPPLIISEQQIHEACEIIGEAYTEIKKSDH